MASFGKIPHATIGALIVGTAFLDFNERASAQTAELTVAAETEIKLKHHVHSVAFAPGGKMVAVGTDNVTLYDFSDDKPVEKAVLKINLFFGIPSIQFSPNGKLLAMACSDQTVRVWSGDPSEPSEVCSMKGHTETVRSVSFSPNGKFLASGGDDETTVLWEVGEDGKLTLRHTVKKDKQFNASVGAVGFSARLNTQLVTVNTHGNVRIFNVTEGKQLSQASVGKIQGTFDPVVAVSPDGKNIAVGNKHNILTSFGRTTLKGHNDDVTGLCYSASGGSLASCSRDGRISVWSTQTNRKRLEIERGCKFTCIAFPPPSPDAKSNNELVLVAGSDRGEVLFFKLAPAEKK
jgi:WD40 repeat protein